MYLRDNWSRVAHVPFRRSLPFAFAALALAACGTVASTMPLPTPADFNGIFEQWALNGVSVGGRTSGDPGCDDRTLVDNAVHVLVRFGPGIDDQPYDVYLFHFRNRVRWADGAAAVDACQAQFEGRSARAGGPVERIDISPYRAFGAGWSPEFRRALESGLVVAAGDGGLPRGNDANLTPQPTVTVAP